MEWSIFNYKELVMTRYLMIVFLMMAAGCRSMEKSNSSYTVETVTRTAVNPYDGQLVDKIDLSITLRKQW